MKKILLLLLLPIITFAQNKVIVHMNTDSYPTETRWVLYADSLYGSILDEVSYGHYTQPNTLHSDTVYIPSNITNITFIIWDSYGDGMSGSYYVDICNDTIISTDQFSMDLTELLDLPGDKIEIWNRASEIISDRALELDKNLK